MVNKNRKDTDKNLSIEEESKRLAQQAKQTADMRHPLYKKVRVQDCKSILDVGCGNGAVLLDLQQKTKGEIIGVESNSEMVEKARKILKKAVIKIGDAHNLPFDNESFELVTCNLLLMWVKDPQRVVREMARVIKKGGRVLAAIEPDYGGKIENPTNEKVKKAMVEDLKEKGANPYIGRELKKLFTRAKLKTEIGISYTSLWTDEKLEKGYKENWPFIEKFLRRGGMSEEEISMYKEKLEDAIAKKEAVQFLPVFYAIGKKI